MNTGSGGSDPPAGHTLELLVHVNEASERIHSARKARHLVLEDTLEAKIFSSPATGDQHDDKIRFPGMPRTAQKNRILEEVVEASPISRRGAEPAGVHGCYCCYTAPCATMTAS